MQRASLGGDHAAFVDLLAEDALVEWPHTPPGLPSRVRGRENIRALLARATGSPVRLHEIRSETVHRTLDPEVIIAEYEAHGEITTTGRPYRQQIILVIRVRDGRIVSLRDYLDPLVLAQATGRSQASPS
ncbi:nuclear transport factor 2 family protein [Streptosporangium carneum]|uniref:nuclear transport factor 2 family protein n=1 Tax=Streptosporangium carneum TaxID=47481 RepID=UPI0022F2CE55|nr:nuclear transport factor 2 family protein [Streptosporangium carneum]